MTTRRTFLKLAAAAGAAMGIVRYAEPLEEIPEAYRDWIEDRGDFFIVRVPALKIFENEELLKPTIFLLGERAMVRDVFVEGFINLQAPRGGMFIGNLVDASKVSVGRDRPATEIVNSTDLTVSDCLFKGSGRGTGIQVVPLPGQEVTVDNCVLEGTPLPSLRWKQPWSRA